MLRVVNRRGRLCWWPQASLARVQGALVLLVVVLAGGVEVRAGAYSLDLSAPGAFAGWAGDGTYGDPVVPFGQGGTIECWLKPTDIATGELRVIAASETDYWFHYTDDGHLGMRLELGPGNYHTYTTAGPVVTLGEWQHVAVTYDLTTVRFYVDGSEVHAAVTVGGPIWGAHNVMLGGSLDFMTVSQFGRANLDDVRFWSTVRTEAQIRSTMCEDAVTDAGLIVSWEWEQTVIDSVASVPCPLKSGAMYSLDTPECISIWQDLGNGLAGSTGLPVAIGEGSLLGGSPVSISVSNGNPFAPCSLVVGVSNFSALFKGGTLVPHPDLLFAQTVDLFGEASFGGLWPPGIPSGFTTYFQYWIVDAAGPQGFAASNAVSGTTP